MRPDRLAAFVLVAALLKPAGSQVPVDCQTFPDHTMCRFSGIGPRCGEALRRGVADQDKAFIVDLHNRLRSQVASGGEVRGRPGPQPAAADMLEMVWDEELAAVAQRWADQCQFGHDTRRDVSRFRVGQNVFESGDTNGGLDNNFEAAIRSWFDEVALFSHNEVSGFRFDPSIGHYTQMMWASTRSVGCGFVVFREGRFTKKYVVCNYGPGGNLLGAPIYAAGAPCSACPAGTTCSARYSGLCSGSTSGPASALQPVRPALASPPAAAAPVGPPQPAARPLVPGQAFLGPVGFARPVVRPLRRPVFSSGVMRPFGAMLHFFG